MTNISKFNGDIVLRITIVKLFSLFIASRQKKRMHSLSREIFMPVYISARFIVKNAFHLARIETYMTLKPAWKNVRDAENAWRNKSNSNRS